MVSHVFPENARLPLQTRHLWQQDRSRKGRNCSRYRKRAERHLGHVRTFSWQASVAARCVPRCARGQHPRLKRTQTGMLAQSATSRQRNLSELPHSAISRMPLRKMKHSLSSVNDSQARKSGSRRSLTRVTLRTQRCGGITASFASADFPLLTLRFPVCSVHSECWM